MPSELARLQSDIDRKGGKTFSILIADTPPRLGTYIALAKAIQDAGHLAVVIKPENSVISRDELIGFESVRFFIIPVKEVKLLRGVDLLFSSEVLCDIAPPGAVTIGIIHSIPDAGLKEDHLSADAAPVIRNYPTIIRTFDYMVVAVRQRDEDWALDNYGFIQNIYPAHFLHGRRSHLDIIPGGYPKIDYSREILASSSTLQYIIYSPTSSRGSAVARFPHDGEAILMALIEAFPQHKIVFRPYPGEGDRRNGRAVASRFDGNSNFIFDESATGVVYQKECAVVVTDSSSSAVTFSLATGRPLIFVSLKPKQVTPKLHRVMLGFRVESLEMMIEAVDDGIHNAATWKETIREAAGKILYNPGRASEYIARNIRRLVDRETHPDWLSVERRPWIGSGRENEVEDHLEHLRTWNVRQGSLAAKIHDVVYDEINEYFSR